MSTLLARAAGHRHRTVRAADVQQRVHGAGPVAGFNRGLAVWVTAHVGTVWCAYLFTVLALIALPGALATGNVVVIVAWVSQAFLQLVLLSIIMVGQRVQSAASDARAEADHETLDLLHQINTEQLRILNALEKP